MLSFSGSLKIYVALDPCDMRKGFNGLETLVREVLVQEVRHGALFLFANRRRTRLKILYWDGSGLWVMSKRLEQGTFSWPQKTHEKATGLRLSPEAFAMLTDGVDLKKGSLRPWYQRED